MSIAGGFFGGGGRNREEEDDTKGTGATPPEQREAIEVDLDSGVLVLPPTPGADRPEAPQEPSQTEDED